MAFSEILLSVSDGNKVNTRELTVEFTFESDQQKIDEANLGKTPQTCKVCGATGNFQTWQLIEMFYGTEKPFRYFGCDSCDCFQIEVIPEDMSEYYYKDYYSYSQPLIEPPALAAIRDTRMILDVGCGGGGWLCQQAKKGCVNLHGCDPYIEKDITYANKVRIFKRSIHEMEGSYDLIYLSHSFEHMPDPHEVFQSISRLLRPEPLPNMETPKAELIIPTYPSITFDVFGPFTQCLDAPRHFFMHSDKSIALLAEKNNLYIESKLTETGGDILVLSRYYQMGVPYIKVGEHAEYFNENDTAICAAHNHCAALAGRGDVVTYTLKRRA